MRMPRYLFVLWIVFQNSIGNAQYFQYSQYNFTDQRVNPAMIGLTRYATVSLDFRHQQTGTNERLTSNFLSASYPLLNSSTGEPWSGVGIAFHDDRASGIFQTQEVALSYAGHIHLAKFQTLSLGMKALYRRQSLSYDGYFTGSQYVEDHGFDPSLYNGENLSGINNNFRTFSAGMYWQQTDKKKRVLRYLGISLFDINRPEDSFLGSTQQLSSTSTLNGGFQLYSRKAIHVFPELLMTFSNGTQQINTGIRLQKELNPKSKQLSDRLELLAKYAHGRSGILGIQLHRENISVGFSYDFPLLAKNVGNAGAIEVGIELRKLVSTRNQKIATKRKKENAAKAAVARKNPSPKPVAKTENTKSIVKDTSNIAATTTETPAVEIIKLDSVATSGQVGNIKQEPLLVEKITLLFAFEFNSSELDDATETFLKELATTLAENEYLKVKITGHTDNIGSDHFNLKLSQKRADAVRHHLLKMGIDPARVTSEGKGMREPLNNNLTDDERAKNRRVVIAVYY